MKNCIDTRACFGRREFLVKAGLVAGGAVLTVSSVGKVFAASPVEDVTVAISADSPLAKIGGSRIVDSSAGKIIVIRTGEAKFVAFSAKCTHKGGTVDYDHVKKQLACPKHGSRFDAANGSVANGPAEVPLAAYAAKGSPESVTISVRS